jgi:hypothetical protein
MKNRVMFFWWHRQDEESQRSDAYWWFLRYRDTLFCGLFEDIHWSVKVQLLELHLFDQFPNLDGKHKIARDFLQRQQDVKPTLSGKILSQRSGRKWL